MFQGTAAEARAARRLARGTGVKFIVTSEVTSWVELCEPYVCATLQLVAGVSDRSRLWIGSPRPN